MAKVNVRHVQRKLEDLFRNIIDVSDAKTDKQKTDFFYTRSQAAYALVLKAKINPEEAAKSVTDGFKDGGIDALYIDKNNKMLYIVQSKWVYDGEKSPESGEMLKFIKGFNKLTDGDFKNFNKITEDWYRLP